MESLYCMDYKPLEICEALGDDQKWYSVKINGKNEDGTFSCNLQKYGATWDSVQAHNLRKMHRRSLPRDLSGDEFAKKPSASSRKERRVMFDETFSEFDENPLKDFGGSKLPRGSIVTYSETTGTKDRLSIQISNVLDDYRKIHTALSGIGSDFSESGPKVEEDDTKLNITITCTKEKVEERKLTILLPESPAGPACANPFSWFFSQRKPKRKNTPKKKDRRLKVKKSLEETIQDDVSRGSNLYSSAKNDWTEEDLQLYQNEIQAEINRLRNASSVYEPRLSDMSFSSYMSSGPFRLSDSSMPSVELKGRRAENVVWRWDGTMVKSEDRERGATYFLEDPTLQPGFLPYTKRLQISNQWDVDSTMISMTWVKGDKVEVWLKTGWLPATITDCVVENNLHMLRVSCNQSDDEVCHTVSRFGKTIRPWGYIEPETESESESD